MPRPRRSPPAPINPLGPGVAHRLLRIAPADMVRLGALLSGYDHLTSFHDGPAPDTLLLVTTPDRLAELDAVLAGLAGTLAFDVLP